MQRSTSISRGSAGGVLPVALGIAGFGSLLILLDFFGTPVRVVGLIAVIAGAVPAAPYADRTGSAAANWWTMIAAGSGLAVAGTLIGIGIDSLGGLVAVAGGALVAVGAILGFPAGSRR